MATKKTLKIAATKSLAILIGALVMPGSADDSSPEFEGISTQFDAIKAKLVKRLETPVARFEKREALRLAREAKIQARKQAKEQKALERETKKAEKLAAKEAAKEAKDAAAAKKEAELVTA